MTNKYKCRFCKDKLKQKHKEISHFTEVIAWDDLANQFTKREYKKFQKWMFGQTCTQYGVYSCDLERYLNNRLIVD